MTVVAITASRTSPGATSLGVGLAQAWHHRGERSLLIEADPAGGVLALRFGLAAAPSLTTFASDIRNGYRDDLLWANTQDLRGVRCLAAPVDPRLARSWIERVTPTVIDNAPHLGVPTVIDLGWVSDDGPSLPLVKAADTTLIVTRPELAEIQSLLFQIRQVKAAGGDVALVTIGSSPNDPAEIAELAGVRLAAVLPHDPTIAAGLRGAEFAPKKFRRSLLWRTVCALADSLLDAETMRERSTEAMPVSLGAPPAPPAPAAPPYDGGVTGPAGPSVPQVPDQARLVLPDGSGWTLNGGTTITIGRHPQCPVVLEDTQVSRQHAAIRRTEEGWRIADLGSRNGVVHNGRPCAEAVLSAGDAVTIGRTHLRFEFVAEQSGAEGPAGQQSDDQNHEMECA